MPKTPLVLGVSTAGPYCGVALWAGDDVVVARHEELAKGQAERLMPLIDEVMGEAGVSYPDLQALGVGIGPGNFTGIRISVSAVRGLALGLGIPAVGVSLLEALALGQNVPVLASIQAGRDRLFVQRFGAADDCVTDRGPELATLENLHEWVIPGMFCVGNREDEIATVIGVQSGPACFYPASAVARIAATRYLDNPAPPAPLYLRAADAAPARDVAPQIVP